MCGLDEWIAAEAQFATQRMIGAISATTLIMERPGFGQTIIPRPGSILASPVAAHYDPDPDYFFHWFRDSAIVIDALRVALGEGLIDCSAVTRLSEFVQFSLSLLSLDGRELLRQSDFRAKVQPGFLQYLRSEAELSALSGDAVLEDVRVNADGTLDIIRWSRPQMDGPALRSLALLRWWCEYPDIDSALRSAMQELIIGDLAFTRAHAQKPCFDIWEEAIGHHYYTRLVQHEALVQGALWLDELGENTAVQACRMAANEIAPQLDAFWNESAGVYRSSSGSTKAKTRKGPDIAIVLAILHAGRAKGRHSLLDPRVQATLVALEELFEAEYAINHNRPEGRGPAMGRYENDRYYSGGAYFFATLAAGEFYFKLALALRCGAKLAMTEENKRFRQRLGIKESMTEGQIAELARQRGDAFMRTVQAFTPADGALSEQFDRATGAAISAKDLSWSYAAFITAASSRARASRPTSAAAIAAKPADKV